MMTKINLSEVSKTAILTLIGKSAGHKSRFIEDKKSLSCVTNLVDSVSGKDKKWVLKIQKKFKGIFKKINTYILCKRVLSFDKFINNYISKNNNCTVINLACGFDTRFWRIDNKKCNYVELDFPEVIKLKSFLLKGDMPYKVISSSVLDFSWIKKVTIPKNHKFLIVAEGLFMYLKKQEAMDLVKNIADSFEDSMMIFDSSYKRYTRGLGKWFVKFKFKNIGINTEFTYGIENPHYLESYSDKIKVQNVKSSIVGSLITLSIK